MKPAGIRSGGGPRSRRGLLCWTWGPWAACAALWLAAIAWLMLGIAPASPDPLRAIGGLEALTGGVLAGQDTLSHDYPAAWWGWRQVRATGLLPLWNPSWFAGQPFIASQTFMPFYPFNWLSLAAPFPLAFNLQYPLHLALAAAVMAWCARRRGLGWFAAGIAGLSWGLGGHLATLAGPGHIQKLQTLAWLPLIPLGAWELTRRDPRRGVGPLGLGLALQLTAGHLHIVYLSLLLGALEAAAGLIRRRRRDTIVYGPPFSPGRRLAWAVAALALALGLGAASWIPTAEFARLSNRAGELDWANLTRGSLPADEWFEFALPRVKGDSLPHGRGPYLGHYGENPPTSGAERIVSDYAGAGVLLFACCALLVRSRWRRPAAAHLALAAGALVLSLGRDLPSVAGTPLYRAALAVIPGLSHLRAPSVMMALFAYGIVMAAAFGLQAFLEPETNDAPSRERAWRVRGSMLLLAACAAIVGSGMARLRVAGAESFLAGSPAAAEAQVAHAVAQHGAALRHVCDGLFLAMILAGIWAWLAHMPEQLRGKRAVGAALLGALALAWAHDLAANARPFWNAERARPYERFLTRSFAQPDWSGRPRPVRYYEPGNELSNRALTLSDFSINRAIATVHGYHPVNFARYYDLLSRLGFLHRNFLTLFAVDDLLWPMEPSDGAGEAKLAGEPPPGYAPLAQGEGRVLLHGEAHPYAAAMPPAEWVESWPALLDRLADPAHDAARRTLLLRGDQPEGIEPPGLSDAPPRMDAVMEAIGSGVVRLRVIAAAPGWLRISEPAAPGWRAEINGRRVPLLITDGYFMAARVPAGDSQVRLIYDPPAQRLGLYLSLWALGVGAFALARSVRETTPDPLRVLEEEVHVE